ncbi:ABC transporter substrate-binding protein [Paenibacillus sp. GCM10027626]|uniref:ABC transporter substrate-binding protein n=1 Tax=Paenibacillus sp. GCM10027626 TaxID=3273411 RepID=UPI003645DFED
MKALLKTSLSALAVAVIVTGCALKSNSGGDSSGQAESGESKNGNETVSFVNGDWPQTNDQSLPQYEKWKAEFETANPDVTMKTEPYPYDASTFLPKAESGQLPNLFGTYFTEPQKIINAGYAADLTDVMQEYGYDKALNPDMLELVKKDGRTYGFPASGYYMGLWLNVKLFEQAGLVDENGVPRFPKTYEELALTAKTIKEKTGKAGFFFPTKNGQGGWQFMNIAWSFGAEFEKQVDGKWKAVFNSPEAVAALQYVKDLKWKYGALTDNNLVDVSDLFRMIGTDQVGMGFGTADWANQPINDYKMSKDDQAMAAIPEGPKGRYSLMGGSLYMFSNKSTPEQIRAGFKWLKYRGISPDTSAEALKVFEESLANDSKLNRVVGPHSMSLWVDPDVVKAQNQVRDKYVNVNMALWDDYMKNEGVTIRPEEPVNSQELYKALDVVIQAVLTNEKADPQALLDQAVADFQRDYLDKA